VRQPPPNATHLMCPLCGTARWTINFIRELDGICTCGHERVTLEIQDIVKLERARVNKAQALRLQQEADKLWREVQASAKRRYNASDEETET